MASLGIDPTPAERAPPAASASQVAGVRSNEPAEPLPAGVRIIDGERLYSAAWLGGGKL